MPSGLTAIQGLRVGHWTDREGGTGCTVVLCDTPAIAGVDVRGAAPGTRETDLLRPGSLVERVDAIVLSGGSAFGLDAASGVMRFLEERGVGFSTPAGPVPIVPAAVLYDLALGRPEARPDADSGYAACQSASAGEIEEGSVGAGTGATVAKLQGAERAVKGGLGTAARTLPGGITIAALVAVNAVGAIYDPATGTLVAGPRPARTASGVQDPSSVLAFGRPAAGSNTTLGVVATNALLDKAGASRLASMAHDGFALAIRPSHTSFDGDTIFALSLPAPTVLEVEPLELGAAAVDVVAEAILRAIRLATPLHGFPAIISLQSPVDSQ